MLVEYLTAVPPTFIKKNNRWTITYFHPYFMLGYVMLRLGVLRRKGVRIGPRRVIVSFEKKIRIENECSRSKTWKYSLNF